MADLPTSRIRNVALVGHGGVGKTTLAEALLHRAGVTSRLGSVDDGSSALDRDPEEIERTMTISTGVASFTWTASDGEMYRINLLDTPGYPDFVAERDAALRVADLAVVVVSASSGVEVGTESAWRECDRLGLPRFVFVTREDKRRANFEGVLDQLRSVFAANFTPLELPLGEEEGFHGVIDLLTERALEYEPDGHHHDEEVPADLAAHEHDVHDQVVEEIVAGDDEQLARYLDGDVPDAATLERTLAREVREGSEVPVLAGSGATGIGVDRLADFICELGPSPADRPVLARRDGSLVQLATDPAADPVAFVFRTVADQYVGQVSLFKVLSGTIAADSTLADTATGTDERLHGLFRVVGTDHEPVTRLVAGDIGAAAKLTSAATGSTLAGRGTAVRIDPSPVPSAHYAVALTPVTRRDADRISEALHRLVREDPSLSVDLDDGGHQTVLRGVGDIHVAVALARLERKFGVAVTTDAVKVPYRATVTRSVEAEGRVKKQSGGHGQYAVVNLRVAPLPAGGGFEFVDAVVGGAIPKNYVAAVRHGIEQAMAEGGADGIPIVDVRVECLDGKTHSVDSSDMAFRTAAASGFRDAVAGADPVVLEPVSSVAVTVPVDVQGAVLSDISARRGKVVGSESLGDGVQHIVAHVPAAELARYALDLRTISGGRGTFSVEHSHYEPLPVALAEQVRPS